MDRLFLHKVHRSCTLNKNLSRICMEKRQNLDFLVLVHRSVHWFKQYFCVIYYGTMSDNLSCPELIKRLYGEEKFAKPSFRWMDLTYPTLANLLSAEKKRQRVEEE